VIEWAGYEMTRQRQQLSELAIVPIDVIEKENGPIFLRQRRGIHDHHANRAFQIDTKGCGTVHCGGDRFRSPGASRIVQYLNCQCHRITDPDTTMTERSARTCEQVMGRGRVQVDVILIRQHEFDEAERVVVSRLLAQAQFACLQAIKIARRDRHDGGSITLSIDQLQVMLLSEIASASQLRQHFLFHDAVGDIPIRAKYYIFEIRRENGRLQPREGATDDDIHLKYLGSEILGGLKCKQPELRDVHENGWRVEFRQPAPAFQSQLDLTDPLIVGRIAQFGVCCSRPSCFQRAVACQRSF
jgi:hypothetical protein